MLRRVNVILSCIFKFHIVSCFEPPLMEEKCEISIFYLKLVSQSGNVSKTD